MFSNNSNHHYDYSYYCSLYLNLCAFSAWQAKKKQTQKLCNIFFCSPAIRSTISHLIFLFRFEKKLAIFFRVVFTCFILFSQISTALAVRFVQIYALGVFVLFRMNKSLPLSPKVNKKCTISFASSQSALLHHTFVCAKLLHSRERELKMKMASEHRRIMKCANPAN